MGTSGLQYAVQIGVHLLDPSRPESSAAFVGKLIIVFVKKVIYTTCEGREFELISSIHPSLSLSAWLFSWQPS